MSGVADPILCTSTYDLSETVKVTLLTSLSIAPVPVHVHMRRDARANDQIDFLLFVVDCVASGLLQRGDVLVMDNAAIHKGADILHTLHTVLHAAGITLWFLPTYSPELNPCEFVFAQCKSWLRYHRRMHLPFWYEIARGMAEVTQAHMINCYHKCIWQP